MLAVKKFLFVTLLSVLLVAACKNRGPIATKPNILWITCEDISPNLGCYGDPNVYTPNLDRLAREGVMYQNAFASAPVCAVARSCIISGLYASSQGTQHMRCKGIIPKGVRLYPELLRDAGYYCTNNVKTDYNFDMDPKSIWDDCSNTAHWRNNKKSGQPFFAIFNFTSSHESRVNDIDRHKEAIRKVPQKYLKNSTEITLPPYYPNTEKTRELMARYYNNITGMDMQVGEILEQLKEDGLEENTIIFFYSDHGAGIPRHKRWLYDSGLHVPWIVKVPEKYRSWMPHENGKSTDELVSFIDLPATALNLAGINIPDYMEGRAIIGEELSEMRKYIFAGRDRMDERYDMQRCVRDKQFKYIRYYESYKPFCQYMNTPEKGAIMKEIRAAHKDMTLPPEGQHIVSTTKPSEELFDCKNDPFELNNLVDNPEYEDKLQELRSAHSQWSDKTKDTGLIPETILRQWEALSGLSIYDYMRSEDVPVDVIRETALADLPIDKLNARLSHENEAVRYWAAINLGNKITGIKNFDGLISSLEDKVPVVRFAAARALVMANKKQQALEALKTGLKHNDEWVRLNAAQVLDEMGEDARPAISSMQEAMDDSNKYVVRVVNHALNILLFRENIVP